MHCFLARLVQVGFYMGGFMGFYREQNVSEADLTCTQNQVVLWLTMSRSATPYCLDYYGHSFLGV